MERELFSASPRAAQMARARLRLALGAFGSSYSSLLATVHLSLSPHSRSKAALARAVKDYPTFSHSTKSSVFNTLTSVSHFFCIPDIQYSTLGWCLLQCFAFHCNANQPLKKCFQWLQVSAHIYKYKLYSWSFETAMCWMFNILTEVLSVYITLIFKDRVKLKNIFSKLN